MLTTIRRFRFVLFVPRSLYTQYIFREKEYDLSLITKEVSQWNTRQEKEHVW